MFFLKICFSDVTTSTDIRIIDCPAIVLIQTIISGH